MMKSLCCSIALLTAATASGSAAAGELSGSLSVVSQYVSRGFETSWNRPTLQGSVEYDAGNGLSAGIWASGVSDLIFEGARTELDLYVAYEKEIGDFTVGASAYKYVYPGGRMSASGETYNYAEIVPSVAWKSFSLSYAYTVSRDYNGYNSATLGTGGTAHSRGSGYVDASFEIALSKTTRLDLHAGKQHIRNFSDYDWADARVGLEHDFGGGWTTRASYARGWFRDGVYDAYTTGVPDRTGVVRTTNPLDGAWVFSLTRDF